jgi:hypothetical protein
MDEIKWPDAQKFEIEIVDVVGRERGRGSGSFGGCIFLSHSAWTLSVFCVTGGRSEKHRPASPKESVCVRLFFVFLCVRPPSGRISGRNFGWRTERNTMILQTAY